MARVEFDSLAKGCRWRVGGGQFGWLNHDAGSETLLPLAPHSPSVEKEEEPANEQGERRPADTAADNGANRRTSMGLGGG